MKHRRNPKIFIHEQILWWLAWLGHRKIENLTISHISEKMFEIMESKLGLSKFKYLMTLITAAREGLLETEVIELLTDSKIVDGELEFHSKIIFKQVCWTRFHINLNCRICNKTLDQFLLDNGSIFDPQQEHHADGRRY